MPLIQYDDMRLEFERILKKRGFTDADAASAAAVFADNSLDGVYSHGYIRFPRMVDYLDKGVIDPKTEATCEMAFGAMERWDGHRGFGPLNARKAMDRACALAREFGIGLVALGNNNHWLRGGSYGWQAANQGMIGICWSNTTPNMPAWGGRDRKIGNNPIIFAVPRSSGEHVVVDCALSQFSFGKLEEAKLAGRRMPLPCGYDDNDELTTDPAPVMANLRLAPMGYWKGSGISMLLDLIATVLTNANSVRKVGTFGEEVGLSQVMIAIDPGKFNDTATTDAIVAALVEDVKSSEPLKGGAPVRYPGERDVKTRKENLKKGIPVNDEVWARIQRL
ncbi:MAG: 3-dehydro-L-gulonate 2-dehydrogenase [Eubacteriales bacterium]